MFSKLSFAINSIASKMMGISSAPQNKLAWYYEVDGQDVLTGKNSFWKTLWIIVRNAVFSVVEYTWELVIRAIYAVAKWILTIIDFIFIFIRQIIGMNTDFSSLEDVSKSDMIFQFIFNENVIKIVRNLILFAIVLLILFSIIAIFMSEYKYVTQGGDNSKKNILVNALKSIFLMAFVPLVVIGGIIMSNAVLKALYIATAGGQDTSLSNQIFVAASYQSNAFRRYAYNNRKIPITYNFSEITADDNVAGYGSTEGLSGLESAFESFMNDSVWIRGFKTFWMFYSDGFLDMKEVDRLDQIYEEHNKTSPYHVVYDMGMQARSEQYYIMADVMDWAMKGSNVFYYKTAEEIFESYEKAKDAGVNVPSEMPIYVDGKDYKFEIWYDGDSETVTYTHTGGADNRNKINGATDEAKGAKFLIAIEKSGVGSDGKTYTYYYPLLSAQENFATDYYAQSKQLIIAKGMFDEGKYPTALKIEDGMVKCYRDDLNVPTLVDLFPHISYEKPEGVTENLGSAILGWGFKTITGVDIHEFIPYLYYNFDIFSLFTKSSRSIVKLDNGMMKLNYNFTQKGFAMHHVYYVPGFNIVILLFGCGLLLGILIKILFGVVLRVLDITLLYITYPAVLSTMPLDNGSRFQGWTDKFIKKVLSVYGVVVGINIVLLLMPAITSLEIFTPADIKYAFTSKALSPGLGSWLGAAFVNFIFQYLFIFVAFSSIEKFMKIIEGLATNWQKSKYDPEMEESKKLGAVLQDGNMVLTDLKALPQKVADVVSGKATVDLGKKMFDTVKGFVPGSAFSDYSDNKADDKLEGFGLKKDRKDIWSDAFSANKDNKSADNSQQNQNNNNNQNNNQNTSQNGENNGATQQSGNATNQGTNVTANGENQQANPNAEVGADGQTPINVPSGSFDDRNATGENASAQNENAATSGDGASNAESGGEAAAESAEAAEGAGGAAGAIAGGVSMAAKFAGATAKFGKTVFKAGMNKSKENPDDEDSDTNSDEEQEAQSNSETSGEKSSDKKNNEESEKDSKDSNSSAANNNDQSAGNSEGQSYVNKNHEKVKPYKTAGENSEEANKNKEAKKEENKKSFVRKGNGKVRSNKTVKEIHKGRIFRRKPKKKDRYQKKIDQKKKNLKQKKVVLKQKRRILKNKKKIARQKKQNYRKKKWQHRAVKAQLRAARFNKLFLRGEARQEMKEHIRALKAEARRIKKERKAAKRQYKDAKADVKAARADVKVAKSDVKLAKSELKEAKIDRKIAHGKIKDSRKILKQRKRKKKNIRTKRRNLKKHKRVEKKKQRVARRKENHQGKTGDENSSSSAPDAAASSGGDTGEDAGSV